MRIEASSPRRWLHAMAAALACCCSLAASVLAQTQQLDRVVAIVDDDIILASEYQYRLQQVEENLQRQNIQAPPREVVARQVDQFPSDLRGRQSVVAMRRIGLHGLHSKFLQISVTGTVPSAFKPPFNIKSARDEIE